MMMLSDTIFDRMLKTMPAMPVLEPFIPVDLLLEDLDVPVDHPRVGRVLEWVDPEHYRAEDRSLSGLACVWVAMRLDPSRALGLYALLRCYSEDFDRFIYTPEFQS